MVPVGAWVARPTLLLLAATWRLRIVQGADTLEHLAATQPAVYALWHENLYPNGYHLLGFARRHGIPLASLVSLSRDGEIAARMGTAHGVEVIRGSTSRGGLGGLRKLRRAITERNFSVVTAPDGPRGPARVFQAGTIVLAATTGRPLVPLAAAASSAWRLRSWDRTVIPKPFSRVCIAIGEPQTVHEDDDFNECAQAVGEAMNDLLEACDRDASC